MTTVIIPTRHRPKLIVRCLSSLFNCETVPNRVVVIVNDDNDALQAVSRLEFDFEIVNNLTNLGFWQGINAVLPQINPSEPFCYIGQDVVFDQDWLVQSEAHFSEAFVDGMGLLSFQDGIQDHGNASHGMTTTNWLRIVYGHPHFPFEYFHGFCDSELTTRSKDLNHYVYCSKAKVSHLHDPIVNDWTDREGEIRNRRHQEWVDGDRDMAVQRLNDWRLS